MKVNENELNKEEWNLWDKKSSLCSMVDTCYIIATDNHKKETMLNDRMNKLKRWICECETEEDLNKMAYQVISFVKDFIIYRH